MLVVTSLYPTHENPGLGAFVASQVDDLRRAGVESDVVFLDVQHTKLQLLKGIFRVRRLVDTGHYDLVHAHFGYNGIPAVLQRQLPVVVSFCGTDVASWKFRGISRWVARRVDACIVKTRELADHLGQPAHVIPNGIDLDIFKPLAAAEARHRLGLSPDRTYAAFVADPGRPEKRYALADAGLAAARSKGLQVEPLVVHGRPHHEIPLWLNAADVVLLTSTREGSPNVIKEAMACNLPIVSTDVGDVREILSGAAGCAIAEPTSEAVGNAVYSAIRHGRTNGRSLIDRLSSESVTARILEIYRSMISKERPS